MRSSPRSRAVRLAVVPAVILAVIAALGGMFYLRGRTIMETQLKADLRDTAALVARHIDPATVDAARGTDTGSPAVRELVRELRDIRESSRNVRYAYILRRTEDPMRLAFVADADALSAAAELDLDADGIVSPDEAPSLPGDLYDVTAVPALQDAAFRGPTTDEEITEDQWGRLISGYAPIFRADGSVAAVLGIDLQADTYLSISQSVLSPVGLLVVLLTALVIAGYVGFAVWKPRMEMLAQTDAERAALMNLASHQLGSPVAMMKWWLEIMREGKMDVSKEEIAAQMEEGLRRMERIMHALQRADSIDSGKVSYHATQASLNDVVKGVAAFAQSQLELRDDRLVLELDEGIGQVRIDPELIGGVVQELVENAAAYSPPHTRITLRTRGDARSVRIEVQDEGAGIPKDEQRRMFEKFVRGKDAARQKPYGNGLGLYIVRSVVTLAHGKVTMASEPGKGSTFTVTLPRGA